MKQNFIRTTDKSTSATLLRLGFQKVDESNGVYTFLNTDKLQFSDDDIDRTKIQYTNVLCI